MYITNDQIGSMWSLVGSGQRFYSGDPCLNPTSLGTVYWYKFVEKVKNKQKEPGFVFILKNQFFSLSPCWGDENIIQIIG